MQCIRGSQAWRAVVSFIRLLNTEVHKYIANDHYLFCLMPGMCGPPTRALSLMTLQ